MNHIHQLQQDLAALQARLERDDAIAQEFRVHLSSNKFKPQSDGTRGDWIATADVLRWLDTFGSR